MTISYEEQMTCLEDMNCFDGLHVKHSLQMHDEESLSRCSVMACPRDSDDFSSDILMDFGALPELFDKGDLEKTVHVSESENDTGSLSYVPFDRLLTLNKIQSGLRFDNDLLFFDEKLMAYYTLVGCCNCKTKIKVYSWCNCVPKICSDICYQNSTQNDMLL